MKQLPSTRRYWAFLATTLLLLTGCGGNANTPPVATPAPLSEQNINLIFVVSQDLTYNTAGDINPVTANLTNRGLGRALMMASYLKQQVLGSKNVTGIYALQPMSHLQTVNNYPDMVAMSSIQQFALLNQITLFNDGLAPPSYTGNSFPIMVSYSPTANLPSGVAQPLPILPCPACQGLDFANSGGANDALIAGIIQSNTGGFYVFSAPWATTSAMLVNINKLYGSTLAIPTSYAGPNMIYAVSITPSGAASVVTYTSNLNPSSAPLVLPAPALVTTACTAQPPFSITISAGSPFSMTLNGTTTTGSVPAVIPAGPNTSANINATVHMIRHAEAHPVYDFEDGNLVAAGQWRALGLADALRGKIKPDMVYSIDPAQVIPAGGNVASKFKFPYIRPSMTVEPYAVANNLPYKLVSGFEIFDDPKSVQRTSDFFFTGGAFSNKTILVAWEHDHYPYIMNALLASYFPSGGAPSLPKTFWPDPDYDTVWTVKLDDKGNLTAHNALCEGINSDALPATAPQF